MIDLQRIGFTGKLDKDTAVEFLKEGDYTDALNVRPITNNTESSRAIVNILGNEYAVSIGSTVAQNKIYSVAINSVALTVNNQLTFKDQNGNLIATTANFNIALDADISVPYAATVLPAITAAFAAATPTLQATVTLSTTGNAFGEVIITLTGAGGTNITGRDYTVESTGVDVLVVSVVQEAYDTSIAGDMQVIGSYDLLGDLFVWSTSQTNLPATISPTITAITNASPGVVTTSSAHGLAIGQLVKISGVTPSDYNGSYIVSAVPTPTTFNLGGTDFTAIGAGSGGAIEVNTQGVGEIGVVQYDPNLPSSNWTYTRLIKSNEFNFVTKKQVDCHVEKTNVQTSIYWTDDYNFPRVIYYKGGYVQDGFLSYYNDNGEYSLSTIDEETVLILSNTNFSYTFTGQHQAGGALESGNWRYSFRFLTENLSGTNWSELSNPVPVFLSDINGDPVEISGDEPGVVTGKINNFFVTGITPNIFQYIEMAAINYVGDAINGYIVSRILLNSNTSIEVSHSGNETDQTTLDIGTLNQIQSDIRTAKNICAIDNRLILSNLTSSSTDDFSTWASEFTYKLRKQTIDGIKNSTNSTYQAGEYNIPSNVYFYTGYMPNETYRFGVEVKFKETGNWSQSFHIGDFTFDATANARCLTVLPNYNITDSATATPGDCLLNFIEFDNIQLDFLIEGKRVRDLIDAIRIVRVECVPEILATGVIIMGASGTFSSMSGGTTLDYGAAGTGEYPYAGGRNDGVGVVYPGGGTEQRTMCAFYSPDLFYGNTSIEYVAGDQLINFGAPVLTNDYIDNSGAKTFYSTLFEYGGYNGITTTPTPYDIDEAQVIQTGLDDTVGGVLFGKLLQETGGVTNDWANLTSLVINTSSNVTNASVNTDYGFYMAQYYRPLEDKYGDASTSKYIPTGAVYELTSDSPAILGSSTETGIEVFGGDVFAQKSFIKYRFANSGGGGASTVGFGGGYGYYSHNRVNSQLNKRYDNLTIFTNYPNVSTVAAWLELLEADVHNPNYNVGYNIKNGINSFVAFDENTAQLVDMPTRIAWSNLKLQNSLSDNYRTFLPLNFKDIDVSFGEIVHMADGNGELLTWQPRKFQRQYFNTTGILQTSSNLNVLIGDGSVLSRNGQTLSTIGSKHKWAIIKGKSPQGNDTFYWINTELKKAVRFGYDGTISLADIRGMQSFLANNLTWVDGKDTPADGEGICGVYDDRFLEVLWSVRGKRTTQAWRSTQLYLSGEIVTYLGNTYTALTSTTGDIPSESPTDWNLVINPTTTWSSATTYATGSVVFYTPSVFSTYEKTGEIYRALRSNTNKNPQTQTSDWEVISHTDNSYYNEYNLVYNEIKNGFTSSYSFLPKIFLKWTNSFLTPQPIPNRNRLYIHNQGEECVWYDDGSTEQSVDGYIEGVLNKQSDIVKWFSALRANTEIVPYRMDFTTKTQESFLTQSEFRAREGAYDSSIKMDSTGQVVNDAETSRLYGKWLKVKMTFQAGAYQSLVDIIVKFRNSVRMPNR